MHERVAGATAQLCSFYAFLNPDYSWPGRVGLRLVPWLAARVDAGGTGEAPCPQLGWRPEAAWLRVRATLNWSRMPSVRRRELARGRGGNAPSRATTWASPRPTPARHAAEPRNTSVPVRDADTCITSVSASAAAQTYSSLIRSTKNLSDPSRIVGRPRFTLNCIRRPFETLLMSRLQSLAMLRRANHVAGRPVPS